MIFFQSAAKRQQAISHPFRLHTYKRRAICREPGVSACALVALAVEDTDEAQHHVIHAQELADPGDEENLKDVSELMGQGVLHQAEHEIRELLGESERD